MQSSFSVAPSTIGNRHLLTAEHLYGIDPGGPQRLGAHRQDGDNESPDSGGRVRPSGYAWVLRSIQRYTIMATRPHPATMSSSGPSGDTAYSTSLTM